MTALAGAIAGPWVGAHYKRQVVHDDAARVRERIRETVQAETAAIVNANNGMDGGLLTTFDESVCPDVFVMNIRREIVQNCNVSLIDLTVMAHMGALELGRIWILRRNGRYNDHLVERVRVALGAMGYTVNVAG
ncbi:MAG: hypothetical protein HY291_15325 [Planctomycetes bacterium]|nr:hypothetical protein [Planctomycetota bacterium]